MRIDLASRTTVRPCFAAVVFGLAALPFFSVASVVLLAAGETGDVVLGISLLCPCVPFAYFAARGFQRERRSAFEALPQRACAVTAATLCSAAVATWALSGPGAAVGPILAAALFAVCVRSFRVFLSMLWWP